MEAERCFLFKPDGIGDFFLASGVIRLMVREFGEENLTIAVLPLMEPVVRRQFPLADVVTLPMRKERILLNLFVANCLACFRPWLSLLGTRARVSISLRHMRDYLQSLLFHSVRSRKRLVTFNLLLGNGRVTRRWTEKVFTTLFAPTVIPYPVGSEGVPSELEAHRLLASAALGREVGILEVWPELRPMGPPPMGGEYWVCAPFSTSTQKDFPTERWVEVFSALHEGGGIPELLLTGSSQQEGRLRDFQGLLLKHAPALGARVSVHIPEGLQDFIDLLAGAACVLTVDTAAAHAATALDCRTLVLFSGQHPGMFGPWKRSHRQSWLFRAVTGEGIPWHTAHRTDDLVRVVEELRAT